MGWRSVLGLRGLVLAVGVLPWGLAALSLRPALMVEAFRPLCHQRADRTLEVFGVAMVDCSRCAGIHAGLALGTLVALPRRWLPHGRALLIGALALVAVDVAMQDLALHRPWHATRLVTGFALGWLTSGFMFAALRPAADHKMKRARPTEGRARRDYPVMSISPRGRSSPRRARTGRGTGRR